MHRKPEPLALEIEEKLDWIFAIFYYKKDAEKEGF